MGMTYDQYWEQDSSLVIAYRKAHRIRLEEQNQQAWIQGMYFLEAIGAAFAKKGSGAKYPERPHPIFREKKKEQTEVDRDREAWEKTQAIKAKMFAYIRQAEAAKKPVNADKNTAKEETGNASNADA